MAGGRLGNRPAGDVYGFDSIRIARAVLLRLPPRSQPSPQGHLCRPPCSNQHVDLKQRAVFMKYKDYYKILGVGKDASADDIKKAYRKLAHKYHPDVSKEPNAEERFKEIGEAYETLKSPEKRAAYDQLGTYQPGQEFRPPPDWAREFGDTQFSMDDIDLADFLAGLAGGRQRAQRSGASVPIPG